MARAIISELLCMPAHIPGELCFRRGSTVCCLVEMRKTKKHKLANLEKKKSFEPAHPLESRRNPPLGIFNKSLCARTVSVPGLAPADSCQDILCVVNRRLHYAGAVGAVNQRACFGRLQGNVEHLRKAAGLLSAAGPLKMASWIRQTLPE